mgnify:CR=1 FL=1
MFHSDKNNRISISMWKHIIQKIINGDCKKVGSGSYGNVYKILLSRNTYIAVKVSNLDYNGQCDTQDFGVCLYEGLLSIAQLSPQLIKTHGIYVDEDSWKVYIATEYCNGGNLREYILTKPVVSENNIQILLFSLLNGVAFMNTNGIMHRDLKPQNILLTRNYLEKPSDVKICDFGLSGYISKTHDMNFNVVTRWYRPPEVELEIPYTASVDTFSIGCIIMEFITRKSLIPSTKDGFKHICKIIKVIGPMTPECIEYYESVLRKQENEVIIEKSYHFQDYFYKKRHFWKELVKRNNNIKTGSLFAILDSLKISQDLRDIILSCLDLNPSKRPIAKDLLQHKYFNGLFNVKDLEMCPVLLPNHIKRQNIQKKIMSSLRKVFHGDTTIDMMKYIRHLVTDFKYTDATFILTFYVFQRYIWFVDTPINNYMRTAIVLMKIIATFVTDHEQNEVLFEQYLSQPSAEMSPNTFRKYLSVHIDNLITYSIIPSTQCVNSTRLLSLSDCNILCSIIKNTEQTMLDRCIELVIQYGRLAMKFLYFEDIVGISCSYI